MNNKNKKLHDLLRFIFATDREIQVIAFNILAVCGIMVSIITAFYYVSVRPELLPFLERLSGVVISIGLMVYTRKTGNYRRAMIITIIVVFFGLFSALFFVSGGYCAGFPFFFVFAIVFTAFLLDGIIMPILVGLEVVWYAIICAISYYYPPEYYVQTGSRVRPVDVVVCETIVSLSLALTMYYQIKMYRRNQQKLSEAIKSADQANEAKSDFIAKMSHDVRTPLNTMLGMNELIVKNTSSERIREWVNDSNVSGQILLSMIDDMLDLSRIEAGRIVILSHPWSTRKVFDDIAKVWKPNAGKSGLEFVYEMDENVPEYLTGDESVIRKITDNLLSNAVKYTKTGSIKLSVKRDDMLRITVSDTGVGIAPEYVEEIFSPYERGTAEMYKETSGSGLGLSIVKELVEAMGGKIECQSVLGEGSVFTVRVPQEEADEEGLNIEDRADTEAARSSKQFVAPDAHILVVDDNAYNRKVIREFCGQALIQIDDVESGYEAVEMIDIKDYDLIFMDIRMPHMDGMQTLAKIKEEYPDFDTPVVALTGDIMNGVESRLMEQGFSGFLAKPVSLARFLSTIKEFIPDRIVELDSVDEEELSPEKLELGQNILMPYGIDLKLALEYCAGNASEFRTKAELFEEYSDSGVELLRNPAYGEDYYLQIHSLKSVARGIGAYLLAELTEAVERRKDDAFSGEVNPLILAEYDRVREGIGKYREEIAVK